jgi:glycosyltransferase involved in cell wall biosynthesis
MRAVQWLALRPLLRRAAALVAVSQFEQRLFTRALGVPPSRIPVVPNGVNLGVDDPTVAEDPDLIVSVGRLEWYKGHHRAIAALPHVLAERPRSRLIILGSGPEQEHLAALAEALGVSERVTIDHVPPEDRGRMRELLASARLVVLLSEYEAHPLAVTEALSLRRRVLVADTSGLSEIAAAGMAWSVPLHATAPETATAMLRAMSGAAPSQMALPTWDDSAEAVHQLYAAILER